MNESMKFCIPNIRIGFLDDAGTRVENSSFHFSEQICRYKTTMGNPLPSIYFKGSGFLGCYQIGVADCLIKNGILLAPGKAPKEEHTLQSNKERPILIGSSAGSLVATGNTICLR